MARYNNRNKSIIRNPTINLEFFISGLLDSTKRCLTPTKALIITGPCEYTNTYLRHAETCNNIKSLYKNS